MKKILISNYSAGNLITKLSTVNGEKGTLGPDYKPLGPYNGHWQNFVSSSGITLGPMPNLVIKPDPDEPYKTQPVRLNANNGLYTVEIDGVMVPLMFTVAQLLTEFSKEKKRGIVVSKVNETPQGTTVTIDAVNQTANTTVRIFGLTGVSQIIPDTLMAGAPVVTVGKDNLVGGAVMYPAPKDAVIISCEGATKWFGVMPGIFSDPEDSYEVRSGEQKVRYDILDENGDLIINSNEFEPNLVGLLQDDFLGKYIFNPGKSFSVYTFKLVDGKLQRFNYDQILKMDGTFWPNVGNRIEFTGLDDGTTYNYNDLTPGPDSKVTAGSAGWDGDIWYSDIDMNGQALTEDLHWVYTLRAAMGMAIRDYALEFPYSRYKLDPAKEVSKFSVVALPAFGEFVEIPADCNPAVVKTSPSRIDACIVKEEEPADPTSKFAIKPGLWFGTEGSFEDPFKGDPVTYKVTNLTTGKTEEAPVLDLTPFGFSSAMSKGLYTVPTDTDLSIYAYINVDGVLKPYTLPCIEVAGTEGFKQPETTGDKNVTLVPLKAGEYYSSDFAVKPQSRIVTNNKDNSEANGFIIYSSVKLTTLDPNLISALNYTLAVALKPYQIESPYFIYSAKRGSPVEDYKIETTFPLANTTAVTELNGTTKITGQVITFTTVGEDPIAVFCEGALDHFKFTPDLPMWVGGTVERPHTDVAANYVVFNPLTEEVLSEGAIIDIPGFKYSYDFGKWVYTTPVDFVLYSYTLEANGKTLTPTDEDLLTVAHSITEEVPRVGNKHTLTVSNATLNYHDFSGGPGSKMYGLVLSTASNGKRVVWSDKPLTELEKPRLEYSLQWTLLPMAIPNKVEEPVVSYYADPVDFQSEIKLAIRGVPEGTDLGEGAVARAGELVLVCLKPGGKINFTTESDHRIDPEPGLFDTTGEFDSWTTPGIGSKMKYTIYAEDGRVLSDAKAFDPEVMGLKLEQDYGAFAFTEKLTVPVYAYTRETPIDAFVPYTESVINRTGALRTPVQPIGNRTDLEVVPEATNLKQILGGPDSYTYNEYLKVTPEGKELVYLSESVETGYINNAIDLNPDTILMRAVKGYVTRTPAVTYFLKDGETAAKYRVNCFSDYDLPEIKFTKNDNVNVFGSTFSTNLTPWVAPEIDTTNPPTSHPGVAFDGFFRVRLNGEIVGENISAADLLKLTNNGTIFGLHPIHNVNGEPVFARETPTWLIYNSFSVRDKNSDTAEVLVYTFEAIGNSMIYSILKEAPYMYLTDKLLHIAIKTTLEEDLTPTCPVNQQKTQLIEIDDSEIDENSGMFVRINNSDTRWLKNVNEVKTFLKSRSINVNIIE